jgi:hypothetical protein
MRLVAGQINPILGHLNSFHIVGDDIQAAINTLADGDVLFIPPGTYNFSQPLSTPDGLSHVVIIGAGSYKTVLNYTGADTTIDLLTVGTSTPSKAQLSGFSVTSSTTMTAGAGMRLKNLQSGFSLRDVSLTETDDTITLFDGAVFEVPNVGYWDGFNFRVQNEGIVIYGDAASDAASDFTLDHGTIVGGTNQIHVGGGFGGLNLGQVLLYGASGSSILIDESIVARGNREFFFSDLTVLDAANVALLTVDVASVGLRIVSNAWLSGAGFFTPNPGKGIDIVSMPSGRLSVNSGGIKDNASHGIDVADATTSVLVGDVYIAGNGGYAVNASVATENIQVNAGLLSNGGDIHSNVREFTNSALVISSAAGSIGSASGYCRWRKVGTRVQASVNISIVTNGTASGAISTTLPFTVKENTLFTGRANSVSGKMLQGFIAANGSTLSVMNYDGTYPGSNGETLLLTGTAETY